MLRRLKRELRLLLKLLLDSGKSESATQQAVNRWRKPMRVGQSPYKKLASWDDCTKYVQFYTLWVTG